MSVPKYCSKMCRITVFFIITLVLNHSLTQVFCQKSETDAVAFTVATARTDGYERFERSARRYGVPLNTLGMGGPWLGGPMDKPGGGHKINLLKAALEPLRDNTDKVVLFTDSYDVIILAPFSEIVSQFLKTGSRVLFSAESFCWPDESLSELYPAVEDNGKRFLNSGMFIGYASDLHAILSHKPVKDTDDDQLFYTQAYLDAALREKHNVQLDHKAQIFQNLNGATADVELHFAPHGENEAFITNTMYKSRPLVIHGNGPSKIKLNGLGNYLAGAWNTNGCPMCKENTIELRESSYPTVQLSIFIEKATPFLEEFFEKVASLDYPKEQMHLFIHNTIPAHFSIVERFLNVSGPQYRSKKLILPSDKVEEASARDHAIKQCINKKCGFYFVVDSDAHLDNPDTLQLLIKQNRSVIAPLLVRPNEAWSNFWGSLSPDGFYERSNDYMDIVHGDRIGVWNVPFVSSVYLVSSKVLGKLSHVKGYLDPDMALCANLRDAGVFMYVTNMHEFGHLLVTEHYDPSVASADLYQLLHNQAEWEHRYIHPEFIDNLNPNHTALQPCPDVYWFPIVSERFCKELIDVMETYGQWSSGESTDKRLEGGYEAVPTRDIHMNQVGLEAMWLRFLKNYVRPLQEAVFTGYFHDPPRSLMNFVVRYRPDEQPSLRPHHDSSTYTINIALNRPGIDYQGGGCHFLRYKCSVTNTRLGWLLMHPGRLTHFHEGLKVTGGTRYIMISFVDPFQNVSLVHYVAAHQENNTRLRVPTSLEALKAVIPNDNSSTDTYKAPPNKHKTNLQTQADMLMEKKKNADRKNGDFVNEQTKSENDFYINGMHGELLSTSDGLKLFGRNMIAYLSGDESAGTVTNYADFYNDDDEFGLASLLGKSSNDKLDNCGKKSNYRTADTFHSRRLKSIMSEDEQSAADIEYLNRNLDKIIQQSQKSLQKIDEKKDTNTALNVNRPLEDSSEKIRPSYWHRRHVSDEANPYNANQSYQHDEGSHVAHQFGTLLDQNDFHLPNRMHGSISTSTEKQTVSPYHAKFTTQDPKTFFEKEEEKEMIEMGDGSLLKRMLLSVFNMVQESTALKKSLGPGLYKDRHNAKELIMGLDAYKNKDNIFKIKHTEEMIRSIMVVLNKIVDEQVALRTCVGPKEDVSLFLQWMLHKSDDSDLILSNTNDGGMPLPKVQWKFDNTSIHVRQHSEEELRKKIELVTKLIAQYEHLTDRDKVKVHEVHEYLATHLELLQKLLINKQKLSSINNYPNTTRVSHGTGSMLSDDEQTKFHHTFSESALRNTSLSSKEPNVAVKEATDTNITISGAPLANTPGQKSVAFQIRPEITNYSSRKRRINSLNNVENTNRRFAREKSYAEKQPLISSKNENSNQIMAQPAPTVKNLNNLQSSNNVPHISKRNITLSGQYKKLMKSVSVKKKN